MRAMTSYSLSRRPTRDEWQVLEGGWRLDRAPAVSRKSSSADSSSSDWTSRLSASLPAHESSRNCGPALRRQRQRFVKQSFDVQPVLWIHRTPRQRGQMVVYPSSPRVAATRLDFDARNDRRFRASTPQGRATAGTRCRPSASEIHFSCRPHRAPTSASSSRSHTTCPASRCSQDP